MYRIEVAPGDETVFRTIEELAIGIRNGVVTPRARIYHHASEKWLPIGLHPHYKKALEMPAASASNAPVTSTTPLPTPSRSKAHPPSHPKPQSVVHFPEPGRAPEPEPTREPKPVSVATPAPMIPAPVQSPVIAMQNEVLRDLPVISIPEPLPWTVKRSPAVAPTVETQEPTAPPAHVPATHVPRTHAPAPHALAPHALGPHIPAPQAPAPHAPAPHALVPHALAPHALAPHALAPHALAPHALAPRVPEPRAPEPRLPERRKPEPYRSMEHLPPVEERSDADTAGLPPARPTARRSRRSGGRPLLLLGTAAALVLGTHLVLTATPPAEIDPAPAPVPAERSEAPKPMEKREEAPQPAAPASPARTRVTEAPRVTSAPARVSMVPGPAFAGSVPARGGADSAAKPKAAVQAPAPEPAAESSISPAPAAIELALPSIPPDSIVPAARKGDTLGMKRILRALNGSKREDPAGP